MSTRYVKPKVGDKIIVSRDVGFVEADVIRVGRKWFYTKRSDEWWEDTHSVEYWIDPFYHGEFGVFSSIEDYQEKIDQDAIMELLIKLTSCGSKDIKLIPIESLRKIHALLEPYEKLNPLNRATGIKDGKREM